MSIRVSCSACETIYQLNDSFAGRKVSCKKCQASIRVPALVPPDQKTRNGQKKSEDRDPDKERVSAREKHPTVPAREEAADEGPSRPRRSAGAREKKKGSAGLSPALIWAGVGGGICLIAGIIVLIVLMNRPSSSGVGATVARDDAPKGKTVPLPEETKPEIIRKTALPEPSPDIKGPEIKGPEIKKVDLPPPSGSDKPLLALDPGGPTAMVRAAFFHPRGKEVITVSEDRSVRRWDLSTGENLQTYHFPMGPGAEGALKAGDISPDGRWLAVAGFPFGKGKFGLPIYLLSLESGNVESVLTGHKDVVNSLSFSRAGRYLASGAFDNTCRLHDLETGKALVLDGHRDGIRRIAFSHNDALLATVAQDRTVRIWSVADGMSRAELKDFPGEPLSVAWHPKEDTLAVGCVDGTIKLFGAEGALKRTIKLDPTDKIQSISLAFSPDGEELLYGGVSFSGRVGLLNLREGKVRLAFTGHNNTVLDARLSKDGTLAITTGGDAHETIIWKVADGSVVHTLKGQGNGVWAVAWRKDGGGFAWGHVNRDHAKGAAPLEHSFQFDDLQPGPKPDGNYGRTFSRLGPWQIQQLDFTRMAILKDGKPLHEFKVEDRNRIYSMTLLPGDRALVGSGFSLDLVDLPGNRVIRTFRGHNGIVLTVSPSPDGKYFLSGSLDQTICLWDPEKTDPLVTFFPAGHDWIAWAPQGYYACSALGERLMGWQVNHGPNQLASFHPAARFRASLFQPDLIRNLFQEKSLDKALALASKEKPVGRLEVTALLPPAVALIAPTGADRLVKTATTEVKVKVRSSGDHPVQSVRLLVDGRPYKGDKGIKHFTPPLKGEAEVAWTVDLLPGKHVLFALAESPVSKSISPPLEVMRVGAKEEELPKLYLLSVGISAYPGKMALQYAHKDATVLEQTLRDHLDGVFRGIESKLLTDAKATRAGILEGLDWLEKVLTPADVAIVFLAGHGARDRGGDFHFIPVDIDAKNPEATTVSGKILKEKLGNLPGRIVIILDACHSGAATKVKTTLTEDLVRDLVSEDTGIVVMCSSQGREFSLESPKLKHGLYTLGLVEALSGQGDFNKDNYIYLHELNFYAFQRVRLLSMGEQNPTLGRPPTLRSFPMARIK